MKNKVYVFAALVLLSSILFAVQLFQSVENVGSAQVSTPVDEKPVKPELIEVSDEDVIRAYAEADKIHQEMLAAIKNGKPKYKIDSERYSHLTSGQSLETKGKTNNQMTWKYGKTEVFIKFELGHNLDETLYWFQFGLDGISMGEFFDAPGIGDKAVLVKNVDFNKKRTNVGLHFVKGRARVSVYLDNFGRSTEKNEKELMEIVRLIEPLINARPNIKDI